MSEPTSAPSKTPKENANQDPYKKIKKLRQRLHEINILKEKIESGDIKTPEPEQIEKVNRKMAIEEEIKQIEDLIKNL